MLVVEQWAELRRLHFVGQIPIKGLARRFDVDRNTVRRALRSAEPPRYERAPLPYTRPESRYGRLPRRQETCRAGSSTSVSHSPTTLIARIVRAIASPGIAVSHHAVPMYCRPSLII